MHNGSLLNWVLKSSSFTFSDIPLQYLEKNIFPLTETKSLKMALLLTSKTRNLRHTCPSLSYKNDSCPKNMNKVPSAKLHTAFRRIINTPVEQSCYKHSLCSPKILKPAESKPNKKSIQTFVKRHNWKYLQNVKTQQVYDQQVMQLNWVFFIPNVMRL